MAELGCPVPVVTREHLQNLVSQGYMTAVELATCRVPTDPVSPPRWQDTLWHAQRFRSEDLVHPHIDSSTRCCSSMAWNYII
jgi:hypothetical protein